MSASRSPSSSHPTATAPKTPLDLIEVRYRPLSAVVDPVAAATAGLRRCCIRAVNSNVVGERTFRYGDPSARSPQLRIASASRFATRATPARRSKPTASSPNTTPVKTCYDVLANFQGPFSLHPVMARALKVPGNRLRLRTPPDSGGSFGVKQAIFPYIVLIAAAARVAGRPVKWIEDRLEHLCASVSATNRVTTLEAAVDSDGRITALDLGPARGLRRASARAGAGHALPHARQSDRRLRHPPRQDAQPRRAHQQDADRAQPRLRRTANLLSAGTADAADRHRAETRSAGRHPAQPRSSERDAVSDRHRGVARFGRFRRRARGRRRATDGLADVAWRAAMRRARRAGTTASALRRSSSRASPTWATSRPR